MLCSSYYKLPSVLASPSLANLFGLSQPAKLNSEADFEAKIGEKKITYNLFGLSQPAKLNSEADFEANIGRKNITYLFGLSQPAKLNSEADFEEKFEKQKYWLGTINHLSFKALLLLEHLKSLGVRQFLAKKM